MNMTKNLFVLAKVALITLGMMNLAQAASVKQKAKPAQHSKSPSILIQKRSFLDSGRVVPIGSMSHYMDDSTVLHVPVYRQIFPSRFGGDVLPERFNMPVKPVSLFTF